MFKTKIYLILAIYSSFAWTAYWKTLPKGVRTLVFHSAYVGKVESEFTMQGDKSGYEFNFDLNSETLSEAEDSLKDGFSSLKEISPEAHNRLTLAKYEISGKAKVNVNVLGFGWGLSKRMTAYTTVPVYKGNVKISMNRTANNNYSEVKSIIDSSKQSEFQVTASDLVSQLDDTDEGVIQSVIVNNFGYRPLGDWEAQSLGDIELGVMYRLTDWDHAGLLINPGIVLPTGRYDDPDILQDFAFGDGQTDLFLEFGGGASFFNSRLDIDGSIRYTHQLSSTKTLRIPSDPNFALTADKGEFKEKLGDFVEISISPTYYTSETLDFFTAYKYKNMGSAKYESQYTYANTLHAQNSNESRHTIEVGMHYSTVNLFKAKKFPIPLQTLFSAQRIVSGINTPTYNRFDIELRLFF